MSEEKITIYLTLEGDLANKFREVKEDLGFKHNTNVLRYLIANEYEKVVGSGRRIIPFDEDTKRKILEWAEKVGLAPQEFVEEALTKFLKAKTE